MSLIIGLLSNVLGLYLAHYFVAGFTVSGSWKGYLIAGLALGILNFILRPILKIVSYPLIFITLGLFLIVIHGIILWLAAQFTGYIVISDTVALLEATLIISAVNYIIHLFI